MQCFTAYSCPDPGGKDIIKIIASETGMTPYNLYLLHFANFRPNPLSMLNDTTLIPLHTVYLLVGYFSHTSPEQDPDRDEGYRQLWIATELLVKHLKNTIDPEEKQALKDWFRSTGQTRRLFRELPQTSDQKIIYRWLVSRWNDMEGWMKLN